MFFSYIWIYLLKFIFTAYSQYTHTFIIFSFCMRPKGWICYTVEGEKEIFGFDMKYAFIFAKLPLNINFKLIQLYTNSFWFYSHCNCQFISYINALIFLIFTIFDICISYRSVDDLRTVLLLILELFPNE